MEKQNSLIDFERARAGLVKFYNSWIKPAETVVTIPIKESNTYFEVGDGTVQLYTLRDNPDNYRFDIYVTGSVETGEGMFSVNGDITNVSHPYRNFFLRDNSTLKVINNFTVSKGRALINGHVILNSLASFTATDGASVIFSSNSVLTIPEDAFLFANTEATIDIYGTIETTLNKLKYILNNKNIHLDSQVHFIINNIENSDEVTLISYANGLRNELINVNSIDELNINNSRIGYEWVTGTPVENSFGIELQCLAGPINLGNFKITFLGIPSIVSPNLKIFSDLFIEQGAQLTVSDSSFYYPTIYIGALLENSERPANFIVKGKCIFEGETASLILDRNGKLIIEETGTVVLKDKAVLKITESDDRILLINGKLIVDSFEQIQGLNENQIQFGPKGKLVILNSVESEVALYNFPSEFRNSVLGKIMNETPTKVELHLTPFKGIRLDSFVEHFEKELKNWFGNFSLEAAVQNKIVVWENNAVLELDSIIIPWVNENENLYSLIKIFPCNGSDEKEKLQNLVNAFKEAKFGNLVLRIKAEDSIKEIHLCLETPSIENAFYDGETLNYYVKIKNSPSYLYLANGISSAHKDFILKRSKKMIPLLTSENYFNL